MLVAHGSFYETAVGVGGLCRRLRVAPQRAVMTPRRRFFSSLLGGAVVLALIVGLFASPSFVEWLIQTRARRAGIDVFFASSSVGLTEIRLDQARFRLVGAPQIAGSANRLTIEIFGPSLRRLRGDAVSVQATGSAGALGRALAAWAKAFPDTGGLDASLRGASLRVVPSTGAPPSISVTGASVEGRRGAWTVRSTGLELYGASLGATELEVRPSAEGTVLAIGGPRATAPVVAILDVRGPVPVVTGELRPTALPGPSGGRVVTVSGSGKVKLLDDGATEGSFSVTLRGFVPPGPREIGGLFGASTQVDVVFASRPSSSRVELSDVQVVAGALALRGNGHAEVPGPYAVVSLALSGSVPCAALGATVVKNTVGGALGGFLGGMVSNTVTGNVPVSATVRADTRRLSEAQASTRAEIRCGLGP